MEIQAIMTNQITRNSFIFYRSFFETIEDLDEKQQLEIYRAIADYSLNDKLPKLTGISKTIFKLIEPQLLANKKRFENGKLGAEHGKKGGRPKTPKKPQDIPTQTPNKNNNLNPNVNLNLKSELESINVNLETWQDFIDFRFSVATKKKPFTERAAKLILVSLKKMEAKQKGFANTALENSIKNSWLDVYEPKSSQNTQSSGSYLDYLTGGRNV